MVAAGELCCLSDNSGYENTQNTFPYNTIVLIWNIGLYKFDDYLEYTIKNI